MESEDPLVSDMEVLLARLREVQERADKAEQQLKEAEKRRDDAEKRRDDAERRRDDAEKRRDDAESQREAATQRTDREQKRADREQKRADREQKRANKIEERTKETSLIDYLKYHHKLVYSSLAKSGKGATTTKGSVSEPKGKYCPKMLQPWVEFPAERDRIFGLLKEPFPDSLLVFDNKERINMTRSEVSEMPVICEQSLGVFLKLSVHNVINRIVRELVAIPGAKKVFSLGDDLSHEYYNSGIADIAIEVGHGDLQNIDGGRKKEPDQVCLAIQKKRRNHPIVRRLLYVAEYKPPHKLTVDQLREGLCPMDIPGEFINNATVPARQNSEETQKYLAKKATASAVSQEYHYMVKNRLEYGLLTTGEAFVFLKIDWKTPGTLYYHLALPAEEVNDNPGRMHTFTAIGQCLVLVLLAHDSSEMEGEDRAKAIEGLAKWIQDPDATLESIPETPPPLDNTSDASGRDNLSDDPSQLPRMPIHTRSHSKRSAQTNIDQDSLDDDTDETPGPSPKKKKKLTSERCMDTTVSRNNDDEDPSDDENPGATSKSAPAAPATAVMSAPQTSGQTKTTTTTRRTAAQVLQDYADRFRPYCTQKCLLGLVDGKALDEDCPNVALHAEAHADAAYNRSCHPVSHEEWLELLENQMRESTKDGIIPLDLGGARGVLFQVTLIKYGYTFVSKGTMEHFIKDLEHEAAVYTRLKPIQGVHVPVFLGTIDLRPMNRICYHSNRVCVVHMICLSWAGDPIPRSLSRDEKAEAESMATVSLRAIHEHGVVHKDVRLENIVGNPKDKADGLMVIDFHESLLLDPPKHPLGHLMPTQRKRNSRKSSGKLSNAPEFSEDFGWLGMAFL